MGLERMVMSQVSQSSLASCRKEFKSEQAINKVKEGSFREETHSMGRVWATSRMQERHQGYRGSQSL